MKRFVEEVFVTEGVPQFTFVSPPNFVDILLDLRRPGKPVIVEGQSGTGKTTCVKKILERLDAAASARYLTARDAAHVSEIVRTAQGPTAGTFVIDDFHRRGQDVQRSLADIAKVAAERAGEDRHLPKLVLIGINQIGSDLIQLVPDIAKRTGGCSKPRRLVVRLAAHYSNRVARHKTAHTFVHRSCGLRSRTATISRRWGSGCCEAP